MSKENKLLVASFIIISVVMVGFIYAFWSSQVENNEGNLGFNQFYDIALAQWQAPETYEITKYNPVSSQTDSTPTITASNQKVREGIVAHNYLPFGTKVEIGDKTYEVQDRGAAGNGYLWFDILTFSEKEAKEWGRQQMIVKILEN